RPAIDPKAGGPALGGVEPRLGLLIDECWRHSKAIGAFGAGQEALESRTPAGSAGLVTGEGGPTVFGEVHRLLGSHRVWERLPAGGGAYGQRAVRSRGRPNIRSHQSRTGSKRSTRCRGEPVRVSSWSSPVKISISAWTPARRRAV